MRKLKDHPDRDMVKTIEDACDKLTEYRKEVSHTYDAITKNAIKKTKERTYVAAHDDDIEAYWNALTNYIIYSDTIIKIAKAADGDGMLDACKHSLKKLEEELEKDNSEEEN